MINWDDIISSLLETQTRKLSLFSTDRIVGTESWNLANLETLISQSTSGRYASALRTSPLAKWKGTKWNLIEFTPIIDGRQGWSLGLWLQSSKNSKTVSCWKMKITLIDYAIFWQRILRVARVWQSLASTQRKFKTQDTHAAADNLLNGHLLVAHRRSQVFVAIEGAAGGCSSTFEDFCCFGRAGACGVK